MAKRFRLKDAFDGCDDDLILNDRDVIVAAACAIVSFFFSGDNNWTSGFVVFVEILVDNDDDAVVFNKC